MKTFDNIRYLLYWHFWKSVWQEKPKPLRSIDLAGEKNPGSNTTIQDAEEVFITRMCIDSALSKLPASDVVILSNWYKRERTKSQLADLRVGDEFKKDYKTRLKMREIEEALEPELAKRGLLGREKYEEATRYSHQPKWLTGAKEICAYLNCSMSWFNQLGLKNESFKKCLHKVGHTWRAHTDDIDAWIKSH